jgi:hypothetical protein
MKTLTLPHQRGRRPFLFTVLLAGIFLVPAARAQSAAPATGDRFLLVFDTSSDMKRRVPAVQKAITDLLASNLNGQLKPGDSLGVWTYDQELLTGQFPLQRWMPENVDAITANINAFVGGRRYSKKTSFDALVPMLYQLVRNSERLTVIIFCDGYGEIRGTPFDTGINQVFQQRQSERQKARLPIVIVLRSQRGQYTGCMASFPPQPISLPEFPSLPEAASARPTNAPAVTAPPRSNAPALIIVGRTITNRVPPAAPKPPPEPKPALTNPPPVTNATPEPAVTNAVPAPAATNRVKLPEELLLLRTNTASAQNSNVPALSSRSNAVAAPAESFGAGHQRALAFGVAFGVAAGGLAVFFLLRGRNTGGSNPGGGSPKKD